MRADVSVLIPCYNSSSTIRRALLSVVRQTLRPTEIIVVDDCSTDESFLLAKEMSWELRLSTHFVVLRNDRNIGPSATRNIAWGQASCRYVAFLDSDDIWLPHKLERQYSWMLSHPEYVLSGHKCLYPNDTSIHRHHSFKVMNSRFKSLSNTFRHGRSGHAFPL